MDRNKQVIAKEDLLKLVQAFNTLPTDTVYDVAYSHNFDMLKTITTLRELTSANNDGYQNVAYGGTRKKTGQPVPAKLVERANYIRIIELINEGFKVVVLMRGLPGSGKTTLAREILHNTVPNSNRTEFIFSADDFFWRNGRYNYDVKKLEEAHRYCQEKCFKAMSRGVSPIIIDNTNVKQWEMRAYCAMGVQFGYCIEICEPETPWARDPDGLSKKNAHKVPKAKIITMLNNFETEVTTRSMLREFNLGYQCPMPQKRLLPPLVSKTSGSTDLPLFSRQYAEIREDEEMRLALELSLKETQMSVTNNNFMDEEESPYEKKLPPILEYIHKPKIVSSNSNAEIADSTNEVNINSTQKEYVYKFHTKPLQETAEVKNEPVAEPTPEKQDNSAMSLIDFSEETPTSSSNMSGHFPLMPVQVQNNTSANTDSDIQNKKMKSNEYDTIENSAKQTNVDLSKNPDTKFSPNLTQNWTTQTPTNTKQTNVNLSKNPDTKPQFSSNLTQMPTNTWNTQTSTNTKQTNINSNPSNPNDFSLFGPNLDALQSWNTQQPNSSVAPKVNNDDLSSWGTSITKLQSWDTTLPVKSTSEPTITITRKISPEISTQSVQMSDKQTNTSVEDFNFALACPEKSASGMVLMGTNRPINANNVMVKVSLRSKITVDVGCMTEEDLLVNGLDHNADHVAKLREFFPLIPIEYMLEVYEKCQKDINWTMELLAETDYIPALPERKETKQPEPMEQQPSKRDNSTETTPLNSWDMIDPLQEMLEKLKKEDEMMKLKRQLEENVTFKREHYSDHTWGIKNIKQGGFTPQHSQTEQEVVQDPKRSDSTSDSDENSEDYNEETNKLFQVDLGAVLVNQLEKICGNEEKVNQRFSTVVQMPESMARQLHALYLESICLQIENQSSALSGDEELAKQIQEEEHNSKEPDLKRIMDEQLAEFLQQKDMQQYKNISPDDLATRLTRIKLYEAFPTLTRTVVDDVLAACNYSYKDAVFVLISSVEKNTIQGKGNLMDPPISEVTLQEMKSEKAMIDKNLVEDDEAASAARTAQSFRDEATACLKRRKHLQELVNMYHQKGMGEVAVFYSELARKAQQQLDYANQKASYLYMYENTAKLNDGITLDLHYLYVKEAVTSLDVFVDHQVQQLIKQNKRQGDFYVITGRGNRSSNGKSKIKPAVIQRLRKRKIRFCEINPGLLKLKLHQNLAMDTDI